VFEQERTPTHYGNVPPTELEAVRDDSARSVWATDFTTTVPTDSSPTTNALSAHQLGLVDQGGGSAPNRRTSRLQRAINAGKSADYTLADRANSLSRATRSIGVLSLKGGVGKTTTTVGLGMTLSAQRGDRVVAVDANPDFGTLAQRGPNDTNSTVRTLLADPGIERYSDVRRHTSQNASRLEFLGSERDPAISEAFGYEDYLAVHNILDRFYNVIITDCGTGLTHSALGGVLDTADALVVVGSVAIDSARSALATLDWLQHHGYAHLLPRATVVLNTVWSAGARIDMDHLSRHFRDRVSSVIHIPYDDHLAEGIEISLDRLDRATRQAYHALATAIMGHPTYW
jgi:MinD-like ATPase involved in chromosome partitioning or flagellar assembly